MSSSPAKFCVPLSRCPPSVRFTFAYDPGMNTSYSTWRAVGDVETLSLPLRHRARHCLVWVSQRDTSRYALPLCSYYVEELIRNFRFVKGRTVVFNLIKEIHILGLSRYVLLLYITGFILTCAAGDIRRQFLLFAHRPILSTRVIW